MQQWGPIMDFSDSVIMAGSAMKSQGVRIRVASENIANADSVATQPGGDPYRRKMVTFKNELNRTSGLSTVSVDKIIKDQSEFRKKYDPHHPGADKDGYVKLPNVNPMIEMMDIREAQRSFEANLNVIKTARSLLQHTIDVLQRS